MSSNYIKKWDDIFCAQHVMNLTSCISNLFLKNNIKEINYLDVGANVGKVYDLLSKRISINNAYLIEASPLLFNYMTQKYADDSKVKLFNFAAYNEETAIQFDQSSMMYQFETDGSNLNLGLSKIQHTPQSVSVNAKCISTFLNEQQLFSELSFIKIDTETVDFMVLADLLKVISLFNVKPLIEFEKNHFLQGMSDAQAQCVLDEFVKHGYKPLDLGQCHGDGLLVPERFIEL
jgi:FkbM family methyltransferase